MKTIVAGAGLEKERPADIAFETYRSPLMAFFLRRVRNRWEAEDMTQTVLLKLLQCDATEVLANSNAYIFKAAANLLKDRARRNGYASHHELHINHSEEISDDLLDREVVPTLIENRTPDRVWLGKEMLARITLALAELGERTQQVFILYRLENMKQREIAGLLGISVSAVEKHLVRGLAHLARQLEKV